MCKLEHTKELAGHAGTIQMQVSCRHKEEKAAPDRKRIRVLMCAADSGHAAHAPHICKRTLDAATQLQRTKVMHSRFTVRDTVVSGVHVGSDMLCSACLTHMLSLAHNDAAAQLCALHRMQERR